MDNFDALVTDPQLTRNIIDAYVEHLPENLYLVRALPGRCVRRVERTPQHLRVRQLKGFVPRATSP